jgi:acetylornithine deacetylase/succinyl-diaminopimelate desuccinylase-like protein
MDWKTYLDAQQQRFTAELAELVSIPSVAAKPENAGDVRRAADWVASRLRAAGIDNARVMRTSGQPVVYGDWLQADGPTILIYGHYDVQPAEPFDLWETPPFEPVVRDGIIVGRGASDDKGGLLTPILAAEAFLKSDGALPINVKFLFEGEEEVGSVSLPDFIAENADLLKADMIFSADGLQWAPDQPQILQAMKGTVAFEIRVRGPQSDQHSGFHGGGIANPAMALAQLLATMKSTDGRVTIAGFYDDVVPLSQHVREQLSQLPYEESSYLAKTGAPATHGEPGYTVQERIGTRPMLDINGLTSGWQGIGSKTVLPAEASAKVTCRIVANQSPQKVIAAVRAHISAFCPPGVTAELVTSRKGGTAFSIPDPHEASQIAAEVLDEVYGRTPYRIWAGGSIPATAALLEVLDIHTVMLGFSHSDENLHAPNEFFRLDVFRKGQEVYGRLFEKLGASAPKPPAV